MGVVELEDELTVGPPSESNATDALVKFWLEWCVSKVGWDIANEPIVGALFHHIDDAPEMVGWRLHVMFGATA